MHRGFWSDFRGFAVKGNALELAVAVVVGTAFGAVINSFVGDIVTPVIGLLTNHVDFKTLTWQEGSLTIAYGSFLQALFNFFIITLSIFLVFRFIAAARRRIFREGEKSVPPEAKPAQERLLEEIRDLLRRSGKPEVGRPTD